MTLKHIFVVLLLAVYAHAGPATDADTIVKECAIELGFPESEHAGIIFNFNARCFHKCALEKSAVMINDEFDLDRIFVMIEAKTEPKMKLATACYNQANKISDKCDAAAHLFRCVVDSKLLI